jgi:hypothetical protein
VEFAEQFAQAQDSLEIVGGKSGLSCELRNLRGVEFHVRTQPSLEAKKISGTMSFPRGNPVLPRDACRRDRRRRAEGFWRNRTPTDRGG